ncbi:MAG: O-antigen ligase family protein [Deltaproteobacteria bacterium]|nr:O-antigen ligase family protein [Deltaproteobacteria bacterium]
MSDSPARLVQGVTALCLLLPIAYFPGLINLYRLPKFTLLALLTTILLWGWCIIRRKEARLPVLPLFFPILFYLLVSTISLFKSINPYEGLTHLLLLLLGISLFWIAANHITLERVSALFHWVVIAGGIVAFLGIVQAWGINIPTLLPIAGPGSTFGNKNMAAQYLLFVLPAAFYLLLSSSKPTREWLYAFLTALASTHFIYTGTRAAWGAATAALIILWFSLRARGLTVQELLSLGKRKWSFLSGIMVFAVAMNTIPPYFIPNFGGTPTLSRLQSMLDVETDTDAQLRFAIWANTIAIFKDHPFLGVGKGNFQFIYPLYSHRVIKDPSFSVEVKAAEAHNDYLQLLAEIGFVGTGAFLWILILLARKYWRGLKANFQPSILAVGFALAAILLEAFWDFPFAHPVPTAFFWIYAGLMWGLSQDSGSQPQYAEPRKSALGVTAFLALCATAALILSFFHLSAEFYFSRAMYGEYEVHSNDEKLDRAEKDLTRATQLYPYDYRYHHWKAVLMMRKGNPQESLQASLRALSMNRYHINTINNLGVAYSALENIPKAIRAFETSIKIWPDYVGAHNNLGKTYEKLGQREKAIEEFQASLRINPEDEVAKENLAILLKEEPGKIPP